MTQPSTNPFGPGLYPGSKQRIRTFGETDSVPDPEDTLDLGKPLIKRYGGVDTEFYTSGQLAFALNRKPGTVRLWERQGTIPKSTFTLRSGNRYAKRRLYIRPQIEGLRRIAIEEGILSDTSRHITKTHFAERAAKLFKELS